MILIVGVLAVLASAQAQFPCGAVNEGICTAVDCSTLPLTFMSGNLCPTGKVCCEELADPPTTVEPTSTEPTTVPPPPPPTCGEQGLSPRVLGAEVAPDCSWPWVVSIRGRLDDTQPIWNVLGNTSPICQGVFLGGKYVLTTGICVALATYGKTSPHDENLMVVVGEQKTDELFVLSNGNLLEQFHEVANVDFYDGPLGPHAVSPDLISGVLGDDNFALLTLKSVVVEDTCHHPVCQTSIADEDEIFFSKDCVMASWGQATAGGGASPSLRFTDVKVFHTNMCTYLPNAPIASNGTCGRFSDPVHNLCNNDNGAMIVCQDPNSMLWKLYGMASLPTISAGECVPLDINDSFLISYVNSNDVHSWIEGKMNSP